MWRTRNIEPSHPFRKIWGSKSDRPCWCKDWVDYLFCRNSRASLSVLWRRMAAWMRETLWEVKTWDFTPTQLAVPGLLCGMDCLGSKQRCPGANSGRAASKRLQGRKLPLSGAIQENEANMGLSVLCQSLLQSLARFWSLFGVVTCGDSNI